jgi:hypothetical protein
MKKYILLATLAVSSLHASDRDEYYNSLLAKAGATPAPETVDKASRDEYYASLLASMQNNNGPKPAVKSAKLAEPSADAMVAPAGSRQTETSGGRKRAPIQGR